MRINVLLGNDLADRIKRVLRIKVRASPLMEPQRDLYYCLWKTQFKDKLACVPPINTCMHVEYHWPQLYHRGPFLAHHVWCDEGLLKEVLYDIVDGNSIIFFNIWVFLKWDVTCNLALNKQKHIIFLRLHESLMHRTPNLMPH